MSELKQMPEAMRNTPFYPEDIPGPACANWDTFLKLEKTAIGLPGVVSVGLRPGSKSKNIAPSLDVQILEGCEIPKIITDNFPEVTVRMVKKEDCITEIEDM
jgi:hypothetical protein